MAVFKNGFKAINLPEIIVIVAQQHLLSSSIIAAELLKKQAAQFVAAWRSRSQNRTELSAAAGTESQRQ
jgi:hypothetical protein